MSSDAEELSKLVNEVEILRECRHENITGFIQAYVNHDDLWVRLFFFYACVFGPSDHATWLCSFVHAMTNKPLKKKKQIAMEFCGGGSALTIMKGTIQSALLPDML